MNAATDPEREVDRSADARTTPRRVAAWAARIRTGGGDVVPCRVVDISDGGAGLNVYDAPESLAIGESIDLEMLGTEMDWRHCDAHVRHVTPLPHGVRVGVEFASPLS